MSLYPVDKFYLRPVVISSVLLYDYIQHHIYLLFHIHSLYMYQHSNLRCVA